MSSLIEEAISAPVAVPIAAPSSVPAFRRQLVSRPHAQVGFRATLAVAEARAELEAAMRDYVAQDNDHVMLVRVAPGVGKSFAGVRLAEEMASTGRRVFFAAPRKDYWLDAMGMAAQPDLWYRWLPRQQFNSEDEGETTCWYSNQIAKWMARGYDAMDFCAQTRICGWDVINSTCPYHKQKETQKPIIFGQHAHIAVGHPLLKKCKLLIADESFYQAFVRLWRVPAAAVFRGMDRTSPAAPVIHELQQLAEKGAELTGADLCTALGGAQRIIDALGEVDLGAPGILGLPPYMISASEVDNIGYAHLPALLRTLYREAQAHATGASYIGRATLRSDALWLNLRYMPTDLPAKTIILDGSGNAEMYAAIFGREVKTFAPQVALHPDARIFQVVDRANGKSAMVKNEKKQGVGDTTMGGPLSESGQDANATPSPPVSLSVNPGPSAALSTARIVALVGMVIEQRGYRRPLIVTHQAVEDQFAGLGETAHFYGVRGTNRFQQPDAVFVIGAPQPAITDLARNAAALLHQRMEQFNTTWTEQLVQYQGHDFAYPVSGFWRDPDLSKFLPLYREDEILQAAHRGRPILNPVHVWLLTNIPLDELPPTDLLRVTDIIDCPDDMKPWPWLDLLNYAALRHAQGQIITTLDLVRDLQVHRDTARKYMGALVERGTWERIEAIAPRQPGTVGKPVATIAPILTNKC